MKGMEGGTPIGQRSVNNLDCPEGVYCSFCWVYHLILFSYFLKAHLDKQFCLPNVCHDLDLFNTVALYIFLYVVAVVGRMQLEIWLVCMRQFLHCKYSFCKLLISKVKQAGFEKINPKWCTASHRKSLLFFFQPNLLDSLCGY